MSGEVTNDVLESFIACRYKGHLKLTRAGGAKSDFERLMLESRERVRRAAIDRLLARRDAVEDLKGGSLTPAILKRGVPLILNVKLQSDGIALHVDAIQRVAGASRLGAFHYVPVLIHESERPGPEQRALLEILSLILGDLQGRTPATGRLMHGAAAEIKKPKLDPAKNRTRQLLKDLRDLHGGGSAPRLVRNPHCQRCEFNARCMAEATEKDDLSLLRGVTDRQIQKYMRRGIFTVTQLSCTFRAAKRGRQSASRKQFWTQPALQALSIREKKIHIVGTPEIPSAPTEIFFDVEGDPDRGFDYLIGLLIQKDGCVVKHSLWADHPTDELQIFQEFLDLVDREGDYRLFAFGSYEAGFIRRLAAKSGRADLVARILDRTFNVLSVLHSHVYLPTYSNGLKEVGNYLGCQWTEPDASGLQSIVWRRRWEQCGSAELKEKLTTYNMEDCTALKRVTEFLAFVFPRETQPPKFSKEGFEIVRGEEINPQSPRPDWGNTVFALSDFAFVNERAHFDYQREKVLVRTSKFLQRDRVRTSSKRWKKNRRVNQEVEIESQSCNVCGGTNLTRQQNRSLARLAFDLRITRSGIKRWITRYRTTWHHCAGCGTRFLPANYLQLQEFCHALKSWAMYEHVAHRTSLPNIAETIRDSFNMPMCHTQVHAFKALLADYYRGTYQLLFEKIACGALIHADETEVRVRKAGKGYVWVFTNLEEVVYIYRPSREGDFLHDQLKGFRGVLISDFYAAYDSIDCPQQKCLIHLLRDFNQDLVSNPWDQELKSIASAFGCLLRTLVSTVDQYGLKHRHLGKHRRDIDRFFRFATEKSFHSEVAQGYRNKLHKYRDKLFTFTDHDGVPWNNNNAEHAIKTFAYYREVADNLFTETGLSQYLVLLSIYQTCKYKGLNFLRFLLSGETDIDTFRERRGRSLLPAIEIYREGAEMGRPSRKRLQPEYAEPQNLIPASTGERTDQTISGRIDASGNK